MSIKNNYKGASSYLGKAQAQKSQNKTAEMLTTLQDGIQRIRRTYALPITIKDGCWIGGGVVILPGITIGYGSVIGAGSIVTKDIPANSLAVGNPCKVIRQINQTKKP